MNSMRNTSTTPELRSMRVQSFLLLVLVVLAVAISLMFYIQTERAINAYICDTREMTVSEGITLYQLVRANCDGNLDEALDDTIDIYGRHIGVGEKVLLPQSNDCSMKLGTDTDC